MENVSYDFAERNRQKIDEARRLNLVDIEKGLVKNVDDSLIHSFHHLDTFKRNSQTFDLKWAVISAVHAGELLINALLIRSNCPPELLFMKSRGKELSFHPPSLNHGLLGLLEEYGTQDDSPIKVTQEELSLLRNTEILAHTRNELMHRTIVSLQDHGDYAKSALSTLIVFEQRYHDVNFPSGDEFPRMDAHGASLLSWFSGEGPAFYKQAHNYLKSVGASLQHSCPVCGGECIVDNVCRICRTQLCSVECGECGAIWHEPDESGVEERCLDCGATKENLYVRWLD